MRKSPGIRVARNGTSEGMDASGIRQIGIRPSKLRLLKKTRQGRLRISNRLKLRSISSALTGTEKFWLKSGAEEVLQVRAAYLSEDDRTERYWASPRPHYRAVGRNRLNVAA